ncbi:PrpF domain-containing protein [Variovorax saccharolyticus]|uniref:PrpF domain-containing protein n=1 Tax=Variovorax saccharolyticus TaxID=3053516 RepID=UPI0025750F42|nr:PrpF domain-containing protein [Variovorax sp. J22R187]MDM0021853.1 PrpF domain-containing protein [Variovorax sp. J22R187]
MNEQTRVKTTIMRGGTSKALFLNETQIPADLATRNRLLLTLFGSPDRRQIDGLGGADLLTSKCAIIGPSTRPDADIDYTFAQIGIEEPTVSYEIVCGNISSAAAVFAIEEGYVRATDPLTTVRIHNTNTNKVLRVKVQTHDGMPRVEGDSAIDGAPGSGAEVALDYSDSSGGATGKLLPTGEAVNHLYVTALGKSIPVSIVDIGTICVFFRAADIGLSGIEALDELPDQAFEIAEELRQGAVGLCNLPVDGLMTPFQIMVGPAQSYLDYAGTRTIQARDVHMLGKMIGRNRLTHKAYPGGGTICTSVAARIEGSIVHQCMAPIEAGEAIRIGHPSGVITARSDVVQVDGAWKVNEVLFSRTARRLMEGYAFVRNAALQAPAD